MIFKTLQFLLLYIRYDTDSNQARVRDSNDRMVLNYLAVTSVRLFLSSHAGRLHSHAAGCIRAAALPLQRQSHRLPLLSSSRCIVVRALESRFVKEGYLLGIAFMGFRSSELRQLLQVAILFSYPAALREPHGRRADGVDVVARR